VTDSDPQPVLSAAESRAAEALLTRAWGERVEIQAAERIWNRAHVVRLRLAEGRSVVLKRRRSRDLGHRTRGFEVELATLEYLNAMPTPVAPRLLAGDAEAGVLIVEDLGLRASLADSLLFGGRGQACGDLVAYARALGALHAWSLGRGGELAELRARRAPGAANRPGWLDDIELGQEAFLAVAAGLGLDVLGVASEIDEILPTLRASPHGLVHGDACPDNVQPDDGGCRIFDFETSGWGPLVLDAAYLQAPFPSCWCFASLPGEATIPALEAYRTCLEAAGVDLGPEWEAAVTAMLAGWIVARGRGIARILGEDHMWGTTTMRPRLITWLRNFVDRAESRGDLPGLRVLAGVLLDQLASRWPDARIPDYPALARPGSAPIRVLDSWRLPTPPESSDS
jgi:Ser/Thr protein kinase RdoA (MazF antagonist)